MGALDSSSDMAASYSIEDDLEELEETASAFESVHTEKSLLEKPGDAQPAARESMYQRTQSMVEKVRKDKSNAYLENLVGDLRVMTTQVTSAESPQFQFESDFSVIDKEAVYTKLLDYFEENKESLENWIFDNDVWKPDYQGSHEMGLGTQRVITLRHLDKVWDDKPWANQLAYTNVRGDSPSI